MIVYGTTWPEALIGSVAILGVAGVLMVLIWQIFATGRAGMVRHRKDDNEPQRAET